MTELQTKALALIASSETLQRNPDEDWFWRASVQDMSEGALNKLIAVLEEEALSVEKIRKEEASTLADLDKKHLEALEHFKRIDLPAFVKKWESASRATENPENILNSI